MNTEQLHKIYELIERDVIDDDVIGFVNNHKLHEIASIKYIATHHRLPPSTIIPEGKISPILKCEIDKLNKEKQILKNIYDKFNALSNEFDEKNIEIKNKEEEYKNDTYQWKHEIYPKQIEQLKQQKNDLATKIKSCVKESEEYILKSIELINKYKNDWFKYVTYCDNVEYLIFFSKIYCNMTINRFNNRYDINYYLFKNGLRHYQFCGNTQFMELYLESRLKLEYFIIDFIKEHSLHKEATKIYITCHKQLPPKQLLPSNPSIEFINYSMLYLSPTDVMTLMNHQ